MYIGLFDIWKRLLQSLGFFPDENSRYFAKQLRSDEFKRVKPPEFDSSKQVRVLLFRELNGQDRRLLFDSKSVRKRDPSASPGGGKEKPPPHPGHKRYQESSIEKSFKLNDNQSKEFVYEWQKASPDEQMLREMIFGSVSISYQGTTFKVHTIRSPIQIMLSVVFAAPPVPMFRIGEEETEESGNWAVPASEISIHQPSLEKSETHLAHSVPVNVPSRLSAHYGEDSDSDSLHSHDGYSSLPTTQHLTPASLLLPRSSSYNSLQRRLLRNKATSIEMGLQKPQEEGNATEEYSRSSSQKRVKLGLSIVIHLNEDDKNEERQFNRFLFTHMSLVEGHLLNLKETVVRAYLNRRNFVQLMFEGARRFQVSIQDLYTVPRLPHPEWLTILSSPNGRHLSYSFLSKFAHILRQYDKKETHFFVSTLLTAVLMHHLSWVPSVIPTDSKIHPTQTSHKHTPCWVDWVAKSRPYNPHWVQLSDLYGALGSTLKLSKTVVKGQRKEVVLKFLQVLSYFIRCSDICEQVYSRRDPTTPADHRLQNSLSKSSCSETSSTENGSSTKVPATQQRTRTVCPVPCCSSKQSLPQKVRASSHSKSSYDTDCASDSSKDTCDVSITPTEEHILNSSRDNVTVNESEMLPMSSDSVDSTTVRVGSCHSEFTNFEQKLCERLTDQQQHSNGVQGLSDAALGGDCVSGESHLRTSRSSPVINVTLCRDESDVVAGSCCACVSCPCYDKLPRASFDYTQDSECFRRTEVKECESVEEGYHSMEEPHSPGKGGGGGGGKHTSRIRKNWCPEGLEEVPLTELHPSGAESVPSAYRSFGWSLMAGVVHHYLQDFCLQGLTSPLQEEEVREDLVRWTHTNVLGEQVSEAVCIVADTDKWSVQLLSSNFVGSDSLGVRVGMSSSVSEMCDALLNMCELGIPSESCIIYLEDRLQELYFRSQLLSDYLRSHRTTTPPPHTRISSLLNVDVSDMPLLYSIATTHSPHLLTPHGQNR